MIKLLEKPSVYWDVDNTLVFAWSDIDEELRNKLQMVYIDSQMFFIHDKHVQKIKEFKARGHNVIVWSAGGADWAEMVIKALNIEQYVDVIAPKPFWYFDDLAVEEWIGRRCYVKLVDNIKGF